VDLPLLEVTLGLGVSSRTIGGFFDVEAVGAGKCLEVEAFGFVSILR